MARVFNLKDAGCGPMLWSSTFGPLSYSKMWQQFQSNLLKTEFESNYYPTEWQKFVCLSRATTAYRAWDNSEMLLLSQLWSYKFTNVESVALLSHTAVNFLYEAHTTSLFIFLILWNCNSLALCFWMNYTLFALGQLWCTFPPFKISPYTEMLDLVWGAQH